jgi:hypothetical protein
MGPMKKVITAAAAATALAGAAALAAPAGPDTGTGASGGCGGGCCVVAASAPAPQGSGGAGMRGRGMGGNAADMRSIHELLFSHKSITRKVRQLPNGVETVTTSTDPQIAAKLKEHVAAMYARMKEGRLIRGFDPLFVALFQNADKIDFRVTPLANGVLVVETSNDPYVAKLIQAHAAAVDGFVKEGMPAMHRTTPVSPRSEGVKR